MTLGPGENGLRTSSLRISLPTLGAVSSIMGVIIFIGGWVIGYLTFKSDLKTVTDNVIILRTDNTALKGYIEEMRQVVNNDRQTLSNRLTSLETESKYISQGVAELKIAIVPKR